jgi:hypothetical protein
MKVLPIAAAAGLFAAAVVPLSEPGLGWLLGGLAVFAAVLASSRRRAWSLARVGAAVAVVLLPGAGTLRDAHWLFVLCLLVALPYASLAVDGGGRTWGRLALGATALPVSAPWAVAALARRVSMSRQLLTGGLAGLVLVVVFGALFAGANPAFAQLVRDTPRLSVTGGFVFLVAVTIAVTAAYVRTAPRQTDRPTGADDPERPVGATDPERGAARHRRMLGRGEWVLPLALVDLVFALFVWTEGEVLFGGGGYVLGPDGPTFAGYARSGFWELTLVTVLSLGIVAVIAYRVDRSDGLLIRVLGGALGVLTLVVVASAAFRMATYVQAYGFTRVRLLGLLVELVLGVVVVLVLLAGVRLRGGWLPGAVATVVACAVLGLVAVDPDAVVARTVIGRYHHDGHLDGGVLISLSDDAIPAIETLPEPWRSCVLLERDEKPSTVDSWYATNLSRDTGRAVLRARPAKAVVQYCAGVVETRG